MKINETFIVEVNGVYVKLHYVLKEGGTGHRYFIEHQGGRIELITDARAYDLLYED